MKTKTIPFDLETAKKIQAGEAEGKIKTKSGRDVDILCFNRKSVSSAPIVALIHFSIVEDVVHLYSKPGYVGDVVDSDDLNLVLEVPVDSPTEFKPFDRVLVRDYDSCAWRASFFSHMSGGRYMCVSGGWMQCIPYDGNQDLVGTTNKPKEE